ncbi:class I SAM-dependent methyltransferase [Lucifera butyrica]|nr:class I SAM-dependent methyltransferase [Lucifera butyrica]
MHRKIWEWCFICQALYERGMLENGRKGLGFAVGREPLAALFASLGCTVVATDLDLESAQKPGANWVATGEHAAGMEALNELGLCDEESFRRNVSFRAVNMNCIPGDLEGFDFCWSSCAFEHLGSIENGKQFIYNMVKCLKPGGFAVHTTEYNVSSNEATMDYLPSVLFRKCDFEEMTENLRRRGCSIDIDFTLGDGEADRFVDSPPYKHNPHLKFLFNGYVSTSMSLIIQKELAQKEK